MVSAIQDKKSSNYMITSDTSYNGSSKHPTYIIDLGDFIWNKHVMLKNEAIDDCVL